MIDIKLVIDKKVIITMGNSCNKQKLMFKHILVIKANEAKILHLLCFVSSSLVYLG